MMLAQLAEDGVLGKFCFGERHFLHLTNPRSLFGDSVEQDRFQE